jgi:hypothetical protein
VYSPNHAIVLAILCQDQSRRSTCSVWKESKCDYLRQNGQVGTPFSCRPRFHNENERSVRSAGACVVSCNRRFLDDIDFFLCILCRVHYWIDQHADL